MKTEKTECINQFVEIQLILPLTFNAVQRILLSNQIKGVFHDIVALSNEASSSRWVFHSVLPLPNQPIRRLLAQNIIVTLVCTARIVVVPQLTQIGRFVITLRR